MKRQADREATFREVLAEVSLLDLGGQLKAVVGTMGCWVVFVGLSAAGSAGFSAFGAGIHVPTVIWIAVLVFFAVVSVTWEKSYHEWTFRWFFPKMGFLGWAATTAYITAIIETFRIAGRLPDVVSQYLGWLAVYLILALPGILFLTLIELGHKRLMVKREAALEASRKA